MKFIKLSIAIIFIAFLLKFNIGIQLKSKSNLSEFLVSSHKIKGSFSEIPIKINFHGKTFSDEPLISCSVKVKYETKNCSYKDTSSSSGRVIFSLEEPIISEENKTPKETLDKKDNKTNTVEDNKINNNNTANANNENIQNQVKNSVSNINTTLPLNNTPNLENQNLNSNNIPKFKELFSKVEVDQNNNGQIENNGGQNQQNITPDLNQISTQNKNDEINSGNQMNSNTPNPNTSNPNTINPNQINSQNNQSGNTNSNNGLNQQNSNTKESNNGEVNNPAKDDKKTQNQNKENTNKLIASEVLKTNYKQCENRLKRLSLNGMLDTRLFKNCETTLTTATSGAHSIKFTVFSRESEDNNDKNIELVIPNDKGVSKQDIDLFMQSINTSCKQSTEDITKKVKEMKNLFCSSIKMPKSYKKCEDISDELMKDKCINLNNQIKSMNQEVQSNQQLLNKSDTSNSECNNKAKHLSTKLELLQINKKEATEIFSQLQKTSEELTNEIKNLNQQKEEFSKKVQSKKDKLTNLNEKISTLDKQLEEGNKIKSAENNELMVTQKNQQEYQKSILDQDQKIVKLKEELRQLREKTQKEMNLNSSELESKQNNLAESSKLNNNLSILEADLQKVDKEIKEMEVIVKTASEENQKTLAEKEKLETNLGLINKDISEVQNKSMNQCKRILEIAPSPLQKKLKSLCENSLKGDKNEINLLDDIIKLLKV